MGLWPLVRPPCTHSLLLISRIELDDVGLAQPAHELAARQGVLASNFASSDVSVDIGTCLKRDNCEIGEDCVLFLLLNLRSRRTLSHCLGGGGGSK